MCLFYLVVEGAINIAKYDTARKTVTPRHVKRPLMAAMYASPTLVLQKWLLFSGYPDFIGKCPQYLPKRLVKDRHIVTSQGSATAAELSFAMIKLIAAELSAEQVARSTLFHGLD